MSDQAQGVELAAAYVSLTVSLKGQQREIEQQLAAPIQQAVTKAAQASGKSLDRELGRAAAISAKSVDKELAAVRGPSFESLAASARANGEEAKRILQSTFAKSKLGDQVAADVEGGAARASKSLSRIGNGEVANTAVSVLGQLTSGLAGVDSQAIGVAGSFADIGSSLGPQAAVVLGVGALAAVMALEAHIAAEVARTHVSAADAAAQLAGSSDLAAVAVDKLGRVQQSALVSKGQFALDNEKAIASLRAQTEPAAQQAILQNIGFDLIQAGNSYKDARAAIQRLADAAGVTIPVDLDIDSFQGQVDAAAARGKAIADKIAKLGGEDPALNAGDAPFGLAKSGETRALEADLKNLAIQLAAVYNADGPEAYARAAGEAEKALGGNERAISDLARETLVQTKVQGLNTSETNNAVDALGQLSGADSEADATWKASGKSLLARADAMKGGATASTLIAVADRAAGKAASVHAQELADATAKTDAAKDATDRLTNSLDLQHRQLSALTLNYQVGQAAKAAYSSSIDSQTGAGQLLGAGLSAGSALTALRKGLAGEADGADKAKTKTELAAKAVQQLTDRMKLADPASSRLGLQLGALAAGAAGFTKSIGDSTTLDDESSSALDLGDAYETLRKQARRLPPTFDQAKASLGQYLPEQRTAIRAVNDLSKATTSYLATLIQSGDGAGKVRSEAGRLREEYEKQLRAVGLNEEAVQQYIQQLGLTPKQVETAIKVSGEDAAKFKINAYVALLQGKIPPEVSSSVTASIDSGDLDGAARKLADFAKSNPVTIEVTPEIPEEAKTTLPKILDPIKAALGGYSESDTRGAQAVLALGDQYKNFIAGLASDAPAAIAAGDQIRDNLTKTLEGFGLTKDEAESYIGVLGLTKDQVTTAVVLSGAEAAATKLTLLRDFMTNKDGTGIPPDIQTTVALQVAKGDLEGAAATLAAFRVAQEQLKIHLTADVTLGDITTGAGMVITGGLPAGLRGRAAGGPQSAFEPGIVGERGPELWWPNAAGHVIPADVTAAIVNGGDRRSSRGGPLIGQLVQNGLKPDEGAAAMNRQLRRLERENR